MSNAGKRKKEPRLRKKEVLIIGKHLREVDISVMREFVIKQVEETEHHVSCYSSRLALWKHIKTTTSFVKILEYFLTKFCELYDSCSTGAERFARFLSNWYQASLPLASSKAETPETHTLWKTMIAQYKDEISLLDRSALVSAITSCSYNFFQREY